MILVKNLFNLDTIICLSVLRCMSGLFSNFDINLVSLTQLFEIQYNRISSWKILRNLNREKRCQN